MAFFPAEALNPGVGRRELFGWAAFDFANSGYTTVVLTAVYNAYFVNVVAGGADWATLLWTVLVAISNAAGMLAMPIIGAWADARAAKKRGLAAATALCCLATLGLALTGPGTYVWAALMLIVSNVAFNVGETLNSAFLPEIARQEALGKVSGWGWSFGYCGGLVTLGLSLWLVNEARAAGLPTQGAVAGTLAATAAVFAISVIPTFAWLRERARPLRTEVRGGRVLAQGFADLKRTAAALPEMLDFARLTLTGFLNQCGVSVVVVLSAVYASSVMGFTLEDSILLIFCVNITAALGAFAFGYLEDRIGHKAGLAVTLALWIVMVALAAAAEGRVMFWVAANIAGLAMGSSQSAGRAMVGVLAPQCESAQYFGFWNMAMWSANIVGPLTYGLVTWVTGNNQRWAIAVTGLFFVAALAVLKGVDLKRGRALALARDRARA